MLQHRDRAIQSLAQFPDSYALWIFLHECKNLFSCSWSRCWTDDLDPWQGSYFFESQLTI